MNNDVLLYKGTSYDSKDKIKKKKLKPDEFVTLALKQDRPKSWESIPFNSALPG